MAAVSSLVVKEVVGRGVVKLSMNHPARYNVLSSAMIDMLREQLHTISQCPNTKCVVLSGNGSAFCTGHDIKEMMSYPPEKAVYLSLFEACSDLMLQLRALPQPVIAKVDGVATAAGCQLVSMCDLAIASEESQFATSGINYGLFCSTPAVAISRSMHQKQAFEMLVTGDYISAQEAAKRGLINQCVQRKDLDACIFKLSSKIANQPLQAVRDGKALFYRQLQERDLKGAYQLAGVEMAEKMCEAEARDGFSAFLNKKLPPWRQAITSN